MINTVAETSNYLSTSRYEDVMKFIAAIQQLDPDVRLETFARTNEDRALPLVIAGPPGVVDPASARATGLPVVFVMANIHAGEVEGKEAATATRRGFRRIASCAKSSSSSSRRSTTPTATSGCRPITGRRKWARLTATARARTHRGSTSIAMR